MNLFNKRSKGLTLIEILTSTVILVIVVAAAYATFISAAKMSTFSRDELEAYAEATRWLERVRAGSTSITRYHDPMMNPTTGSVDLNAAGSILQEDYNTWPLAAKPSIKPNTLVAEYTITDTNLGAGASYKFKQISVTVRWQKAGD